MPSARRYPPQPASAPPETVDPRWILKAVSSVLALGLLCAYVTICVFFYRTQWQLVLHPSRVVPATPAARGLAFEPVRFGDGPGGKRQISGWWLPSDSPGYPTVLLLHGADGSMSDTLPQLATLHNAGFNVLDFDYRGYGQSEGSHPTQSTMREDSAAALSYLFHTRHLENDRMVIYGQGLGASLAVQLCANHPDLPALILVEADGDTLSRVLADQRSRIVPVRLLFHERFPLADTLRTLHTPKLLISYTKAQAPLEAQLAADPKTTAEIPPGADPAETSRALRRFVDTYVPHAPPPLLPAGQA